MNQSLLYFSEMNQAVPGSYTSPLMEPSFDCRVPSPSEWSDVCRSPPLLHSPSHFSDYVDKIKEEPYSPQSLNLNYSLRTPPHTFYNVQVPLMSSEGAGEHSINIAELLAENNSLLVKVQQQQTTTKLKQEKVSIEPIDFLGLVDVKTELEEVHEPFFTSQSINVDGTSAITASSPVASSVPTSSGNRGDVLFIALDHYRQSFQEVSIMLNIPSDPSQWTAENVRSWLIYEAEKIEIPLPPLDNWQISGHNLIQLSESQFREIFPKGGNLFYANLEIWKAAFRTTASLQPATSLTRSQDCFQINSVIQSSSTDSLIKQQSKPMFVNSSSKSVQHLSIKSDSQDFCNQQQPPTQSESSLIDQKPLLINTSPKILDIPVKSPSILSAVIPSVSDESIVEVPATISSAITTAQQLTEKIMTSQVISSTQSKPSLVTVTSSAYSLSPDACTSTKDSIIQITEKDIQPMDTTISFTTEDNYNIPTLLHDIGSPTQSSIQSRVSRKSGTSQTGGSEATTSSGGRGATHIHLWQFLKELLQKPQEHGACIRWLDRSKGIFKIEDSVRVARLWGSRKNRPAMNYDKLSRSIRQYYKKGIMKKTEKSQRLVYQFCHPYSL